MPRNSARCYCGATSEGIIAVAFVINWRRQLILGSAFVPAPVIQDQHARKLQHEGIRAGEIVAFRAWRVLERNWRRETDDRLHSVHREDYVWHPEQLASGDVRFHGVYSFKQVISSLEQYGYPARNGRFLFGSVKIWGEIVEHEEGYRSEFARIASLDYGDPELLEKFRAIYRIGGRRLSG
jgi:hypothetical protein